MSNDLTLDRIASPASITAAAPISATTSDAMRRTAFLQALQLDDWDAFESAALGEDTDLNIETDRYDNDQNGLHVAIAAGDYTLAAKLVKLAFIWDLDIINHPDQSGQTPIMLAAAADIDCPELVDALIEAGAYVGLADALKAAAQHNHIETARRLMNTDANRPALLAELVRDPDDAAALKAAKLLISLDMSVTDALDLASQKHWRHAMRTLLLLGANGSEVLIKGAKRHAVSPSTRGESRLAIVSTLKNLLQVGADGPTALAALAQQTACAEIKRAMQILIKVDQHQQQSFDHKQTPLDTRALWRLADAADWSAVQALASEMPQDDPGFEVLASRGDRASIEATLACGQADPQAILHHMVSVSNVPAARTMLLAGTRTAMILHDLLADHHRGFVDRLNAIKLLVAIGADPSILPRGLQDDIDSRRAEIARLSPEQRQTAFHTAIKTRMLADAVMLLDQGVDILATLRDLSRAKDTRSIGALIDIGAITRQTLIERVRAGDMETARAISKEKNIATDALIEVITQGDLELARAFIPALTDGSEALIRAAEDGRQDLTDTLIAIEANGPYAVLLLLEMNALEAAVRLLGRGVDIHATAALAIRNHSVDARDNLTTIGATLVLVLLRALASDDRETVQRVLAQTAPEVGQEAFMRLLEDDTLAPDVKTQQMRVLMESDVQTEPLMLELVDNRKLAALKTLVALGVPTDGLFMDMGRQGNRLDAQTLILADADVTTPIRTLRDNGEQQAANVLTIALTGVRERRLDSRRP